MDRTGKTVSGQECDKRAIFVCSPSSCRRTCEVRIGARENIVLSQSHLPTIRFAQPRAGG
ncbi:hypothetical protein BDM02DRAFT_3117037 [Thelephora ganbajun]|uniref:Uncharacterized protein n=1 Tax=Thelephora ganbajun TaxID=370292 RepID=A0ACB6ZCN1_THEGA|nr:hypothetical protein BDM02DRAFT_3117037 [Thelephora ganbajun]